MAITAYQKPQTLVYQRFIDPAIVSPPAQKAYFLGGDAQLVKFGTRTQEDGNLGRYSNEAVFLTWPSRLSAGASAIDADYTKLFVKSGLFKYWDGDFANLEMEAGSYNVLRSDTLSFADNGDSYSLTPVFGNRGVKKGDGIILSVNDPVSGRTEELHTFIEAILAEGLPGFVDPSVTLGGGNQPSKSSWGVTCSKVAGSSSVTGLAVGTAYNGQADGAVEETYTVSCVTGSSETDATQARLRITTASGKDQHEFVTPNDFEEVTPIGSRGLTVTFSTASTGFQVGDRWVIQVNQKFAQPTATAEGDYTSRDTTTYLVTVAKGGAYGSGTLIKAQTLEGGDIQTNIPVTAENVPVQISDTGIKISFTGVNGLNTGDTYFIRVKGADPDAGKKNRLLLRNNIPMEFVTGGGSLTVEHASLFLVKDVEIPEFVTGTANWSQNEDGITLAADIKLTTPEFILNGSLVPLPLLGSEAYPLNSMLYVQYRNWLYDCSEDIFAVNSVSDLDALLPGMVDQDNPLKFALVQALKNHGAVEVLFTSVRNVNDPESWEQALNASTRSIEVYNIVPLTYDPEVFDRFYVHVQFMSQPLQGLERVLWRGLQIRNEYPILVSAGSFPAMSVVMQNTSTTATKFNEMIFTSPDTDLLALGVRKGDTVRYQFGLNQDGSPSYRSYTVENVVNANALRLVGGFPGQITSAQKVEIWRVSDGSDTLEQVLQQASVKDSRVRYVFPESAVLSSGETVNSLVLAGMIASLSSAVVPQQGLTHYAINGISAVPRTVKMSEEDLNALAYHGIWIVTKDLIGGPFSRHGVTSAPYENIMAREECIVRNCDNITKFIRANTKDYVGISNISPTTIANMESSIRSVLIQLQGRFYKDTLGGQIISFDDLTVTQNPVLKDTMDVAVTLTVPAPMNVLRITLTFQL